MFKLKHQQRRSSPQFSSSLSRDYRLKKPKKLTTPRFNSFFFPTSLAISLCFFLCVTMYFSCYPPVQINGGSDPSTSSSKIHKPGPSNQLPFHAGSGPVSFPARQLKRQKLFQCDDMSQVSFWAKRGPFWVLQNYRTPTIHFACDKGVTYTTHGDYTYLDNLVPLLERWLGPVSLSLYAPGTDLDETLGRVHYLRECSTLVKDFVSFHLITHQKQPTERLSKIPRLMNCSIPPKFGQDLETFRKRNKWMYPVNLGRNVAREMAPTHYVLAADIELYPSRNLMADFLEMIQREGGNEQEQRKGSPNNRVFVLPVFEVEGNVSALPNDKMELIPMLEKGAAIPFHENICGNCHAIPRQSEWMRAEVDTDGLHVFHVAKRQGAYGHWEPFYIGTKLDPMYDERLSWEGQRDKMTQAYILCVLDYEFHILDKAFLVHRPGIKMTPLVLFNVKEEQKRKIKNIILPQLERLYGTRPGCNV